MSQVHIPGLRAHKADPASSLREHLRGGGVYHIPSYAVTRVADSWFFVRMANRTILASAIRVHSQLA